MIVLLEDERRPSTLLIDAENNVLSWRWGLETVKKAGVEEEEDSHRGKRARDDTHNFEKLHPMASSLDNGIGEGFM